jgi:hypothetical protein
MTDFELFHPLQNTNINCDHAFNDNAEQISQTQRDDESIFLQAARIIEVPGMYFGDHQGLFSENYLFSLFGCSIGALALSYVYNCFYNTLALEPMPAAFTGAVLGLYIDFFLTFIQREIFSR